MTTTNTVNEDLLLSIVIPTYNRAHLLALTLDGLVESCAKITDTRAVEIIVLDNQSTDTTRSVVEARQVLFPIKYQRTAVFVPADNNIFNAQHAGCGRYVWVVGDDDPPLPNALAEILAGLGRGNDFLVLNYWFNASSQGELAADPWFGRIHSCRCADANTTLLRLGGDVGFISAVVARREIWQATTTAEQARWLPLHFHQVYAFYKALKDSSFHGELIGAPVFVAGLGQRVDAKSLSWERAFIDGLGLIYDELEHQLGYDPAAVASARLGTFNRLILPKIAGARLERHDWKPAATRAREKLRLGRYTSVRDSVITGFPGFAFRLIHQVYRRRHSRAGAPIEADPGRQAAECFLALSQLKDKS